MKILEVLIHFIAYLLIWFAIDYKRDNVLPLFSRYWWVQLLLVTTAVIIIEYID